MSRTRTTRHAIVAATLAGATLFAGASATLAAEHGATTRAHEVSPRRDDHVEHARRGNDDGSAHRLVDDRAPLATRATAPARHVAVTTTAPRDAAIDDDNGVDDRRAPEAGDDRGEHASAARPVDDHGNDGHDDHGNDGHDDDHHHGADDSTHHG